jgi:hypothetical protein
MRGGWENEVKGNELSKGYRVWNLASVVFDN